MQPYVIKQGNYLASLAYQFRFDADTVWNDPKNADLRQLRPDPNMLCPTDILYMPNQVDKQPVPLKTGSTNSFVSHAPPTPVAVRFTERGLASLPCTIAELPDLRDLTTDGSGVLTFQAPVSLETATITFASVTPTVTFTCQIGHLDPIDTLSGIFQRLQSLGYIDDEAELEEDDLDLLRGGLNALKISIQGPPAGAPLSPGGSSGSGSEPPQSDYVAADDETPASDAAPSGSGPSVAPTLAPRGFFGLSDAGILDNETMQMLRTAHGC